MKKQFEIKWSRRDLISSLDEFTDLYLNRPIKENDGGMKSPHMFPAWFIVKQLQPKYLIESGVWKGLGTWFFEKASPKTKIISIDPCPHFRVYTSPVATYSTTDFLLNDWAELPKDDTFIFFDDHQNCIERLKRAKSLGFKRLIVEDNYPYQQGDCYTPKKVLSKKRYVIDAAGNRVWHPHDQDDLNWLEKNISIYQEMPPIMKPNLTRWGDTWNQDSYPTPDALLTQDSSNKYPTFSEEQKDYTWICYIEFN